MSLFTAAEIADLQGEVLTETCVRQDAQANWVNAGVFPCYHEEATPQTTGLTGFEGAAGYGVNLFVATDQTLSGQDRVVVGGITLEVQRVAVVGPRDLTKRAFCVKRGA